MSREVIIKVLDREEIDAHARKTFYIDDETHEAKVELLAPYQNMGELIRCKDCKYYEQWTNRKICMPLGSYYGNTQPNDYCSYAERKEE